MSPSKSPRSKIAGRSPFHWSRLLTRFVGVSPHRYVVHLRWQRVVELVRHVRSGLADVAVRTGFADQAISRVGSGASTAFPRRNWSPEPKEQESSRSAAPGFLNRGLGRGTTAFAPPDQEAQHD